MSDIVDELKSAAIEELKYELDSKWWIDRNSEPVLFEMRSYRAAATITTLRAEVEKLRAALEWFADAYNKAGFIAAAYVHKPECRCLRCAHDNARAALAQEKQDD